MIILLSELDPIPIPYSLLALIVLPVIMLVDAPVKSIPASRLPFAKVPSEDKPIILPSIVLFSPESKIPSPLFPEIILMPKGLSDPI